MTKGKRSRTGESTGCATIEVLFSAGQREAFAYAQDSPPAARGQRTPRRTAEGYRVSATKRPRLKDARRQFFWGEHELIDYGVPAKVGTSAWAVYTALLRHLSDENGAFPSVQLLEAEIGISNRVIANSLKTLAAVGLISIEREGHQWNVYYILDCLYAIKKNGWKRVKLKAGDESSPAEKVTKPDPEQVTKSHVARDESSPEQVTIRHTKKNQLRTTNKEGGGYNSTGNVHTETQSDLQAPPVAVIEPLAPTTQDAPLLQASVGETANGSTPAGAPGGAEPEDTVTDQDLEILFGRRDDTPEAFEEVPGGAAAGRTALSGPMAAPPESEVGHTATPTSVNLLTAIPEAELLVRPVTEPGQAIYKTIVGLVGGNKVIEEGILDGFTPTGGVPRHSWLRLTADNLDLVRRTAQAEAKATQTSFITLCILGMDRLIGAPKKMTLSTHQVLGPAYETPEEQQRKQVEMSVEPGSTWYGRKSGQVFLIEESNSKSVFVKDLGEYPLRKFHTLFIQRER